MNDLVRMLRERSSFHQDCITSNLLDGAAAEIERLRREILNYEHHCELGRQEIERLKRGKTA